MSIALLLSTAVAWGVGKWAEEQGPPFLMIAGEFRFSAGSPWDPSFAFFNDPSARYWGRDKSVRASYYLQPVFIMFDVPGIHWRQLSFLRSQTSPIWIVLVHPLYLIGLSLLPPLTTLPFRRYRRAAGSKLAVLYWLLLIPTLLAFVWLAFDEPSVLLVSCVACLAGMEGTGVLLWAVMRKKAAVRSKVSGNE